MTARSERRKRRKQHTIQGTGERVGANTSPYFTGHDDAGEDEFVELSETSPFIAVGEDGDAAQLIRKIKCSCGRENVFFQEGDKPCENPACSVLYRVYPDLNYDIIAKSSGGTDRLPVVDPGPGDGKTNPDISLAELERMTSAPEEAKVIVKGDEAETSQFQRPPDEVASFVDTLFEPAAGDSADSLPDMTHLLDPDKANLAAFTPAAEGGSADGLFGKTCRHKPVVKLLEDDILHGNIGTDGRQVTCTACGTEVRVAMVEGSLTMSVEKPMVLPRLNASGERARLGISADRSMPEIPAPAVPAATAVEIASSKPIGREDETPPVAVVPANVPTKKVGADTDPGFAANPSHALVTTNNRGDAPQVAAAVPAVVKPAIDREATVVMEIGRQADLAKKTAPEPAAVSSEPEEEKFFCREEPEADESRVQAEQTHITERPVGKKEVRIVSPRWMTVCLGFLFCGLVLTAWVAFRNEQRVDTVQEVSKSAEARSKSAEVKSIAAEADSKEAKEAAAKAESKFSQLNNEVVALGLKKADASETEKKLADNFRLISQIKARAEARLRGVATKGELSATLTLIKRTQASLESLSEKISTLAAANKRSTLPTQTFQSRKPSTVRVEGTLKKSPQ